MSEIAPGLLSRIEVARGMMLEVGHDRRKGVQLRAWEHAIGDRYAPGSTMTDEEFVIYSIAALTLEMEDDT